MPDLNDIPVTVWAVVFIGIVLGVGGIVLSEFVAQADASLKTAGENLTVKMINDTLIATQTFSDWLPIIIIVVVIGIVITILVGALAFKSISQK